MTVKPGDTIKCTDKEEAADVMMAVMYDGWDADFMYEKDGEEGPWIVIGDRLEDEDDGKRVN